MAKLEEKLKDMDLEETKSYRTREWIKGGAGGVCVLTGISGVPGLILGIGVGLVLESAEAAAILGSAGMVGCYAGSVAYTAKKVYNAVQAGYRIKNLEKSTNKKEEDLGK